MAKRKSRSNVENSKTAESVSQKVESIVKTTKKARKNSPGPVLDGIRLDLGHDGYFLETFQQKRVATAFLKKTLSKETLECLRLDGLEVEKNELVDKFFKKTIADVIYRVPIKCADKNGKDSGCDKSSDHSENGNCGESAGYVNFFVIVEHKSSSDYFTIFQIWGYLYLLCRLIVKAAKDRKTVKSGFQLSPVVAIILHHGRSRFKGKTELADLFCPLPGLREFLPHLRAILFDLNSLEDDDPALDDPEVPEFRVVMMVLKCVFRRDVGLKISDVLEELKPYSEDAAMRRLIRTTWIYLANSAKYLERDFEGLMKSFETVTGEKAMPTMTEKWLKEGIEKGFALGKAEGIELGEAKGKAEAVLGILFHRLGEVPKLLAERVRGIGEIERLEELFDLALDCKSLEEFDKQVG